MVNYWFDLMRRRIEGGGTNFPAGRVNLLTAMVDMICKEKYQKHCVVFVCAKLVWQLDEYHDQKCFQNSLTIHIWYRIPQTKIHLNGIEISQCITRKMIHSNTFYFRWMAKGLTYLLYLMLCGVYFTDLYQLHLLVVVGSGWTMAMAIALE